jgi:hypothetical protein
MVAERSFAPYAPRKAVLQVLHRCRARGLLSPLTPAALQQIGVASTMTWRTLQALRFLGLIDGEGNLLEPLEQLQQTAAEEYRSRLREIIRAAYLPVFTVVDPARDSLAQVSAAFRHYEPGGQRAKMVMLFLGLCKEAGMAQPARTRAGRQSHQDQQPMGPALRVAREESTGGQESHRRAGMPAGRKCAPPSAIDYQVISAIIQQLPRNACWTMARRERWLKAMTAAIDLLIEVEPSVDAPPSELPGGDPFCSEGRELQAKEEKRQERFRRQEERIGSAASTG